MATRDGGGVVSDLTGSSFGKHLKRESHLPHPQILRRPDRQCCGRGPAHPDAFPHIAGKEELVAHPRVVAGVQPRSSVELPRAEGSELLGDLCPGGAVSAADALFQPAAQRPDVELVDVNDEVVARIVDAS